MACRGTGRVISQLGGSPSPVSCPWCEGSGLRLAEIDAQAHWGAEGEPAAGGERQASAAQPGDPGDGRAEDGAAGDADPMAGSAADPPAAGGEASEGAAASSDEEGPGAA
jgi:hypothetical protein